MIVGFRDPQKAALKAAKARGVKFGAANPLISPKGVPALQKARGGRIQRADNSAAEILPIIDGIRAGGITKLRHCRRFEQARRGNRKGRAVVSVHRPPDFDAGCDLTLVGERGVGKKH